MVFDLFILKGLHNLAISKNNLCWLIAATAWESSILNSIKSTLISLSVVSTLQSKFTTLIQVSFLLIIQSKSTTLNVKLWKIGKFSIWVIISSLPVIAEELLSLILSPKKKLKNSIQEKSSLLPFLNPTNLLINSSLQETTTEMSVFSILVLLLFYFQVKRTKFPL